MVLVLLTGSKCSGKKCVAELLRDDFNWHCIYLEEYLRSDEMPDGNESEKEEPFSHCLESCSFESENITPACSVGEENNCFSPSTAFRTRLPSFGNSNTRETEKRRLLMRLAQLKRGKGIQDLDEYHKSWKGLFSQTTYLGSSGQLNIVSINLTFCTHLVPLQRLPFSCFL